jgi:hypothetical protein
LHAARAVEQDVAQLRSNNAGVICPPNVDPAIKAPTPKTGDPPAIPLPGIPGGHQAAQPITG